MGLLENKNLVITGGSRGFGFAIARACSQAGARVAVASRSQKAVNSAVDKLQTSGEVTGIVCDIAQLADVRALAHEVIKTWGRIDVWINNAAIAGPYGPTIDLSPADFASVVNVNILGTYYGSHIAMQHFLSRGHGKLINILGRGSSKPAPMQNVYGSSKVWVLNFTRTLADEYKDSGIGVFAYNPGMIRTDLLTDIQVIEGYEDRLKPMETIIRMWAKPPEVPAQKIVHLASSASDGETGLVIREMSFFSMLTGAAREGFRRLFKRPLEKIPITLHTVDKAEFDEA